MSQVSIPFQLSALSLDDAEALFSVILEHHTDLFNWLYWARAITDVDSVRQYIAERIHSGKSGAQWFCIRSGPSNTSDSERTEIYGVIGVKEIRYDGTAELGYWLSPAARGKGIVTRACRTLMAKLKSSQQAARFEYHCLPQNQASIAVVEKLGGKLARTDKDAVFLNDVYHDLCVYQIHITEECTTQ